MHEYAVFWRDSATPGSVYGGGVAVEAQGVRLRGSDGRLRVVETVPVSAVEAVETGEPTAIAGFPSLRLRLDGGRSIILAAVLGTAALVDLFDNLLALLPG